jgi:hypothetical protein
VQSCKGAAAGPLEAVPLWQDAWARPRFITCHCRLLICAALCLLTATQRSHTVAVDPRPTCGNTHALTHMRTTHAHGRHHPMPLGSAPAPAPPPALAPRPITVLRPRRQSTGSTHTNCHPTGPRWRCLQHTQVPPVQRSLGCSDRAAHTHTLLF